MATGPTPYRLSSTSTKIGWDAILDTETGSGYKCPDFPDKCVQVLGTFGVGGAIRMEGSIDSNDGDDGTWFQMSDANGNAISFTAAGGKQLLEAPLWIRPRVTAGDGDTSLTVYVFMIRGGK